MSDALLSIRTDKDTKKEVTEFANSVGLSVSAFVTVILKQAVKEGRVVLTPNLEPTPYLEKIMQDAMADYKAGKNITRTTNHAELRAYLDTL
ncbi:MAG TPA: type II toxin-antitoxin system RelB/DinJ family antitoxin [Candidatus Saccharimonadales bacterium]|nr:type II toxin-antitoxin system RelB/DinJ family antitoxin [Candidatus Saccharimonadales bacterium]